MDARNMHNRIDYMLRGFPQGFGPGHGQGPRTNPRAYDEYLKAYSVAMMPGRQRENVSYGGKGGHSGMGSHWTPLLTGF